MVHHQPLRAGGAQRHLSTKQLAGASNLHMQITMVDPPMNEMITTLTSSPCIRFSKAALRDGNSNFYNLYFGLVVANAHAEPRSHPLRLEL
jgi:hypothetical protein